MKHILSFCAFVISLGLFAAHHEELENNTTMHENNFVYISTYTQPAGGNPETLKKSLLGSISTLEKNGYNSCGMLRHQFGGDRSFLTYCYFDDWDQFAKINDDGAPLPSTYRQLYGDHTDKLAAVVVRNLTKRTPYVLRATYTFGPFLTANEMRDRAKMLFDAYNEAFEGCVLAEHAWGPEMAWYFYCGYESYTDFAKKSSTLGDLFESGLADAKTDIRNHSDDLMIRIK